MNDDFEERFREVAVTVLGVESDLLSDATSPETLAAWTSIQHLSLIAALEEAFSIQFSMADIFEARSLGALRHIVSEHVARASPHG
jgi:acyl carrier protein